MVTNTILEVPSARRLQFSIRTLFYILLGVSGHLLNDNGYVLKMYTIHVNQMTLNFIVGFLLV